MKIKADNQKGQGLLELVVAIGVITTGLFSVWGLFISNFNGEQEAAARIVAINLAREGVEVIRNIRDSNWLHIEDNDACLHNGILVDPCFWDSGLEVGVGVVSGLFSENVYIDYDIIGGLEDDRSRIYTNSSTGFYDHLGNQPTIYRRLVELKNICCASDNGFNCNSTDGFIVRNVPCLGTEIKIGIDVESKVLWLVKGRNRDMAISSQIYNWK